MDNEEILNNEEIHVDDVDYTNVDKAESNLEALIKAFSTNTKYETERGTVERVVDTNPSGVDDVMSHITVNEESRLIISDCMPYSTTYSFQFWYKSSNAVLLKFYGGDTFKRFYSNETWQHFTMTFQGNGSENVAIQFPPGEYWLYNTKLEQGYYCTGWRPHQDDRTDAYTVNFEAITKSMINHLDTIKETYSMVDKDRQAIENRVTNNTFEVTIDGVTNTLDKVNDGYGKWYIAVFDKTKFENLNGEGEDNLLNSSGIEIFQRNNAKVIPERELTVEDNGQLLDIDDKTDKIFYYLTYAKFSQEVTLTDIQVNKTGLQNATIYVNAVEVLDQDGVYPMKFYKDWNIIEIVGNESCVWFGDKISEHPFCEVFNCCMGIPTERNIKQTSQYSYLNIYLNKVESRVGQQISDIQQDIDGNVKTSIVNLETYFDQTINKIVLGATRSDSEDPEWSATSELEISPNMIAAVTNQFVVGDPDSDDVVIIEKGKVVANSITTHLLATDAIKSTNYIPAIESAEIKYSREGSFLDLSSGNFYSPSMFIDAESGNAYFSGTVVAKSGEIGSWNIDYTSIWTGTNQLGVHGNNNIYLGENGLSLSDRLIYNAQNGEIYIKTSNLSVDGNEFDTAVYNLASGVRLYHSNGVPTSTNYPVNSWEDEYVLHNGDVCIDDQTKKVYQFKYIKDNNTPDRIVIKFSDESGMPPGEDGHDYVQIFYKYKGLIHRCPNNSNPYLYFGDTLKNLEVVIPSTEFWLYWHSDEYQSHLSTEKGFVIENIYGVGIDRELTPYEVFNIDLPNVDGLINRTLSVGQYPVLENYSINQDILWKCTPLLLNDTIEWNEVGGYDKIYAMRRINYIDYDAEEGIVVHDGSYIDSSNVTGGNVRLKNDGLHIYNGQREYTNYGSTTYFYGYKDNGTQFIGAQINADGFLIGSTDSQYLKWDGSNLTMKVESLYIGSTDVSSALSNAAKTATNYLVYDGKNGLRIYADTSSQDNAYNVQIKGDGMYIRKGNTNLAKYGETTYFYSDGSTVAASLDDDNGLYIKKGKIELGNAFAAYSDGVAFNKTDGYGYYWKSIIHGKLGSIKYGFGNGVPTAWTGDRHNYNVDEIGVCFEDNGNFGCGMYYNDGWVHFLVDPGNGCWVKRGYIGKWNTGDKAVFLGQSDDRAFSIFQSTDGNIGINPLYITWDGVISSSNNKVKFDRSLDVTGSIGGTDNITLTHQAATKCGLNFNTVSGQNPVFSTFYKNNGFQVRIWTGGSWDGLFFNNDSNNGHTTLYSESGTNIQTMKLNVGTGNFWVSGNISCSSLTSSGDISASGHKITASSLESTGTITANGKIQGYDIVSDTGATFHHAVYHDRPWNFSDSDSAMVIRSYDGNIQFGKQNYYVTFGGYVYATSTNHSSDERLKYIHSVVDNNYKDLFMNIKPIMFSWKNKELDNKMHIGIGAQTFLRTCEDLGYNDYAFISKNEQGMLSANYTELLMLSVPVVQEHEHRIEALEKENELLKQEIQLLKKSNNVTSYFVE